MIDASFLADQPTPALDTPAEILGLLPDAPMTMPRQLLERPRGRGIAAILADLAAQLPAVLQVRSGAR